MDCRIFPSVADAAAGTPPAHTPRVAIVGAPPFARGTDEPGRDLELQLVDAFPNCAFFIEKPVSSGPEEACWRVSDALAQKGVVVGVGYMLRYLKGPQRLCASGNQS